MTKFIVNSFQVPNAVIDELMSVLSGNAFKCYLLIARKTLGWGKEADRISISQFADVTGVKNEKTIHAALAELEKYKLIITEKKRGQITNFKINLDKNNQYQKPVLPKNGTTKFRYRVLPKNGSGGTTNFWYSTKYTVKYTITKDKHTPVGGSPSQQKKLHLCDKKTAQIIVENFNKIVIDLPAVHLLTDQRLKAIKNRWDDLDKFKKQNTKPDAPDFIADRETMLTCFEGFFRWIAQSDFLMGRTENPFNCSFDWVFKPCNFTKILEGNYTNKRRQAA